jgi:hypothetical protein
VSKELKFRAIISPIMSAIKNGNDMMRVSIDIPKSDIQNAIGLIALSDVPLLISVKKDKNPWATKIEEVPEEKPSKQKKVKEPKGEFSSYWQAMFIAGFHNHPDLQEVLKVSRAEDVKPALKDLLGFDSLTFMSPDYFEEWARSENLHSLITLSRQAVMKAGATV